MHNLPGYCSVLHSATCRVCVCKMAQVQCPFAWLVQHMACLLIEHSSLLPVMSDHCGLIKHALHDHSVCPGVV